MARMSDLIGHDLQWTQPAASKQEYELLAADLVVCRLHVHSSFSTLATATSSEGTWLFNRPGFWQHKATVRTEENPETLATFSSNVWKGGGVLDLQNGRCIQTKTNFWATNYRILDEMENDLISYVNIRGFFRSACNVEIHPLARNLAELPWLVPFGWYLIMMQHRDNSAAAAAT